VAVEAVGRRPAAFEPRRRGSYIAVCSQILVHAVDGVGGRLQKPDVKQPRIALPRRHALVVHQRQDEAVVIAQHGHPVAALLQQVKAEDGAEELRQLRHI